MPHHHDDEQLVSCEEAHYNQQCQTIFLMELKEKTFIDISSHIFDTIMDETRTTSRAKLIFPSLLMRICRAKGVPIPQDLSLMPTPSTINKQTIIRIQVRLLGDVDEGAEQEEGDPMDIEAEAAGQSSTSRSRAKRIRASTSSAIPPYAFQIILDRIDGLREVQNQHTERMTAMQDQLDVLLAKFDSIYTNQEH